MLSAFTAGENLFPSFEFENDSRSVVTGTTCDSLASSPLLLQLSAATDGGTLRPGELALNYRSPANERHPN